MSNETTKTSLTEIVNSEWIEPTILAYAADALVITPLCRVANVAGKNTATASFPAWEKDAGSDLTEGNSDLSNVELQTTENAVVTAAMVGILREVTDFAMDTNLLGPAGLMQMILKDGAYLCSEMLEDDLAALFASASSSVGSSGTDLSVANFVEAIAKLDTNKARGRKVCVLDDQAALDLRTATAAATGAVFGNAAANAQSILNARSDAYLGQLFGVDTWVTNLTDTANTAADVVSIMMIDGAQSPENAPIGITILWEPRVREVVDAATVSQLINVTMAYGCGEISDFNYVKLVTDA